MVDESHPIQLTVESEAGVDRPLGTGDRFQRRRHYSQNQSFCLGRFAAQSRQLRSMPKTPRASARTDLCPHGLRYASRHFGDIVRCIGAAESEAERGFRERRLAA
jgi:hypothetical protein